MLLCDGKGQSPIPFIFPFGSPFGGRIATFGRYQLWCLGPLFPLECIPWTTTPFLFLGLPHCEGPVWPNKRKENKKKEEKEGKREKGEEERKRRVEREREKREKKGENRKKEKEREEKRKEREEKRENNNK